MKKATSLVGIFFALCMTAISFTHACAADESADMGVERVARFVPMGYCAPLASSNNVVRWVQVDLGQPRVIDKVKLLPELFEWETAANQFPVRYKIEVSNDPAFGSSTLIANRTDADVPLPIDTVAMFPVHHVSARYIRVTATKLRNLGFALSKLEVWSRGKDVAVSRPCSDSVSGQLGFIPLTRIPRPAGEEDVTNNLQNVIPASLWKPVSLPAHAPAGDVHVTDGVFKSAMENNVDYLMNFYSADELLRPFRQRAGLPVDPTLPAPVPFWDTDLPGSNAGRFLMGAGNTLRWMEEPKLRAKLNTVVNGISECREPDGYIMGYAKNTIFHFFYSERAGYTRSWVTHGLIAAGRAGNPKAYGLLRGFYDWFDKNPYLPEVLRRAGYGIQGQIADTETYFTPVGKPKDIQVVQQYYQENYWMKELAADDPSAIWQYPYDHPHNYLITALEAYMDQYLATGDKKYFDASLGGWNLYHDDWMNVGGSVAITEGDPYPPKSYILSPSPAELCGSAFWVLYNQRFALLYPNQEKYVTEIEKCIYNVGLADQVGGQGFRYHANLVGTKEGPQWGTFAKNTCCEGQGTRLIGSLPEYIYSLAKDGVYVRLYAPSTIHWKQNGHDLGLWMQTTFPYSPNVTLLVTTAAPVASMIRVRTPSWAARDMQILVNGQVKALGKPGTYTVLSRTWKNGDVISFTLPMAFRATRYTGLQAIPGRDRYAIEYGPILMAAVGPLDNNQQLAFSESPEHLIQSLKPIDGQPLHFSIPGDPAHQYMPYWLIQNETFTCFPIVTANQPPLPRVSGGSWIWFPEGNPSASAPAGTRYFRRQFTIDDIANVKDAVLTLSVDDLSTTYINGKLAGRSLKWQTPLAIDAKGLLKSGVNTIAIEASNSGDTPSPAGLIADLQLDYIQGKSTDVATDTSWKTTNCVYPGWENEEFDDGNWATPISMGPYGMAPWGQIYGIR
jgi:DUF1680 family protein